MNKLGLYCLTLLVCKASFSQFYFRGQVKDDKRESLANVKIYIHGMRQMFKSGSSGDFGITVTKPVDTVTFSIEGYEEKQLVVTTNDWLNVTLNKLAGNASKNRPKLISVTKDLQRSHKFRWNISDETYFQQVENESVQADRFPNTGFSVNVNKASYSNMRRFLNMGSVPPPDAVRIEELLNYFNLHYQEPKQGEFHVKTALSTSPWSQENQLLYVSISTKKIDLEKVPPGNFVFLIDVSGSMDLPNRLPLLKAAFQMLVKNLRNVDTVTIVTYGGYSGVHLPPTSGSEKSKILESIETLEAAGDTPGESAIHLAYRQAIKSYIKGGTNRIILATDGDFNVGQVTEKALEDLIVKHKQSGVHLTCLGVGMGNYKDSKLETLAKRGNGNFAYLDDIREAEKVLVKELTQNMYTVAEDVFLNISFNKERVKEYRLIGFDNKRDAISDSAIDMEGGEVGSGNGILALFEIKPERNTDTTAQLGNISLRYKINEDSAVRTMEVPVPGQLQQFEHLDSELKFGAAVAMFGMRMRESKFAKDVKWDDLEAITINSYNPNVYLQTEFLQLMQKAKKICSVKKKRKGDG